MKQYQQAPISFEAMPSAISEMKIDLSILKDQLTDIQKNFAPKVPEELLTRKNVADIFKCDISTIHNWTVAGKLKAFGIGNRVYYKRSEVESAIVALNH